jgi:uncharacterized protein GlcG (DUF336 family)
MSTSKGSPNVAAGPKLPRYGATITLAQAKQVVAAALAPAIANNWTVVVAVVDPGGYLVCLEKMDQTQVGSIAIAEDKARSSAIFKRPTKMFQERLGRGGEHLLVLRLRDVVPVEGGVPIVLNGELIGALGVSGGSSAEDEVCAAAGASALE